MIKLLQAYNNEMQQELKNILAYWIQYAIDEKQGGFYGKIDHDNKIYPAAAKGSVMNSRILWAFSAAFNYTRKQEYLLVAGRAYHYIIDFFQDKEYGGIYWTLDSKGRPLDQKKQIYALAFAVYALSEYYRCNQFEQAKAHAIELYNSIIKFSYDNNEGGYFEAFSRDWQELGDLRLSEKDANEKKSMNTHLHVLEAFTNLFRIWPDETLRNSIKELIENFLQHIIDPDSDHLRLFFDEKWCSKSQTISYGHDIEAAWLVQEAAEIIGEGSLITTLKERSVKIAFAAMRGLDLDGGLWYEKDPVTNHLVKEKHSWPQAEAMIGFFNAWQNTGNETFLHHSLDSWKFVQDHILDRKGGEWVWGVREDYSIMTNEDKAGMWKCCYHNSRACLEIIRRTDIHT